MRLILLVFLLTSFSCTVTPEKRNADFVVTYDGKETKESEKARIKGLTTKFRWSTEQELEEAIANPGTEAIYLVFAADWCEPCKRLVRIVESEGWVNKLIIINVDEPWVARFGTMLKITRIPTLLVADERGDIAERRESLGPIVTYLVVHLE